MKSVGVGQILMAVLVLAGVIWFMASNTDEGQAAHAQAIAPESSASSAVNAPSKPAQSAWFPFGKGMYATAPIGKNGLDATGPSLLLATDGNTRMPMLMIMISPAPVCEAGGQDISGEINDVFTYYINDKAVPFHGACVVGKLLLKPSNPKAMEDFMGEFESVFHPIVTITAPDGSERQYMEQGFGDAKIALLNASMNN